MSFHLENKSSEIRGSVQPSLYAAEFSQPYNRDMARGWESKSVEAQIEAAAENKSARKLPLTAEQAAELRAKERLVLARKHVLQQLDTTQNPRHRQMLEQALSDLDAQLAKTG